VRVAGIELSTTLFLPICQKEAARLNLRSRDRECVISFDISLLVYLVKSRIVRGYVDPRGQRLCGVVGTLHDDICLRCDYAPQCTPRMLAARCGSAGCGYNSCHCQRILLRRLFMSCLSLWQWQRLIQSIPLFTRISLINWTTFLLSAIHFRSLYWNSCSFDSAVLHRTVCSSGFESDRTP